LPEFNLTHLFCYAGAHIIMGAMGVFTTEALAAEQIVAKLRQIEVLRGRGKQFAGH
jgi:hypothetical protein